MKQAQPLRRYLATLLLLAVTTLTWAWNFYAGGIYYNKNSDGTSVTVTYKTSSDRGYSGSVVIPSTVTYDGKSYSITSIGSDAFSGCTGLTSVTIPNSVTTIGDKAFYGCTGLTSVTIPESVTNIGSSAFEKCSGLTKAEFASIESLCKIRYSYYDSNPLRYAHHLYINGQEVTDLVIPNSVTKIGYCAFSGCSGLTSVTIPNSVTDIGLYAFSNCTGLTKAEFASIESLCNITFSDYSSNPLYYAHHLYVNGQEVTDVVIPNSITSINDHAFDGCSGLTSITIPESVTSIDIWAFYGCTGLKSVTIPNSVTSIGWYAFKGCTGLTSVTCHAQNVPSTDSDVFYGVPKSTATLYVPAESVEAYKSASQWKNFGTILPITPTAVESLTADKASDTDKDTAIYDLNGRRLQHKPARGFYIQSGKKFFVK